MASVQAHIYDALLRVNVKQRMKGATKLAAVRALLEGSAMPPPSGVSFRADRVGVAGEWAETGGDGPVLLYLHGGGYVACSPRTHRPITGAYAKLGFRVFVPDYRLAPEHPYPAAIDDAETVWNALRERGGGRLAISGDSAGGGLCLALMLRLRDRGAALPSAAVLFSPWTDLAATGASIRDNARREAMFQAHRIVEGARPYIGDADPRSLPLASPLFADLAGLPPLLIHVGDREALRDDSTRLAERARTAGVETELRVWPVVPHVWQLAQSMVPEARESMREAAAFLHARGGAAG